MIDTSRLYSFLDEKSGFAFHLLEAQKLIHDLALLHELKPNQFSFFRDAVLASQPLISFFKKGEGFGFYIESEEPTFNFKIETSFNGKMRSLFIANDFEKPVEKISGIVRLAKVMPNSKTPYTSNQSVENQSLEEIVNTVLANSYQINASIHISSVADQSALFMRLPDLNVDKETLTERCSLEDYLPRHKSLFENFFAKGTTNKEEIISYFQESGFIFLQDREVKFECPCSRDRMISGLKGLANANPESLFDVNSNEMEVKCDYCNTFYKILKSELL